jgi:hypothetical protein
MEPGFAGGDARLAGRRLAALPVTRSPPLAATVAAQLFVKPTVTRAAARAYGFDLQYRSRPSWETYACVLEFAAVLRADLADLQPRDMIDIQSFIRVLGSAEYDRGRPPRAPAVVRPGRGHRGRPGP